MSRFPYLPQLLAVSCLAWAAFAPEAHAQASYAASHLAAQQVTASPLAPPPYQQQMATATATYQPRAAQHVPAAVPVSYAPQSLGVYFDGRYATPSPHLPIQVQYAVNAANYLQHKPYVYGGGHRQIESSSYDCSSAVSYALIKGGMLRTPLTSAAFANFGAPGPGRFITIWVKPGHHVFMTVCGLRLDTTGGREREGPRWRTETRSFAGFTPRHPVGL